MVYSGFQLERGREFFLNFWRPILVSTL